MGSEFCPFCAAQRWPLIVALSRFGRFTGLDNMQSAPESVFPGIQTLSFVGSTYTSPYLTFEPVELYSTQTTPEGTFARIANLNAAQAAAVARYGAATGTRVGTGDLPFVDIADRMVATTSGYSPAVLERQSQSTIATDIDHGRPAGWVRPSWPRPTTSPPGCATPTGQRPASVCTSKGVRAAATRVGYDLSSARPAVQELLALHLVESAPDAVRLMDPHGVVEALAPHRALAQIDLARSSRCSFSSLRSA